MNIKTISRCIRAAVVLLGMGGMVGVVASQDAQVAAGHGTMAQQSEMGPLKAFIIVNNSKDQIRAFINENDGKFHHIGCGFSGDGAGWFFIAPGEIRPIAVNCPVNKITFKARPFANDEWFMVKEVAAANGAELTEHEITIEEANVTPVLNNLRERIVEARK